METKVNDLFELKSAAKPGIKMIIHRASTYKLVFPKNGGQILSTDPDLRATDPEH